MNDFIIPLAGNEVMRGHLSGQTRFDDMIEQLYQTAQAICQVIDNFRPDLVIVLAHGAWSMLWATKAYWVSSKDTQAFPPVMVTNLGREKIVRYEKVHENLPCNHTVFFSAEYAGDQDVGYFLSWLEQQQDWIDQFRQQARAVTTIDPERILILDEFVWEGGTYRLSLGLARAAFPKAAVRFINGDLLGWRSELAYPWLEKQIPGWSENQHFKLAEALLILSSGTEDRHIDSLDWKPITSQSRIIEMVSTYLPAEKWLELPGWIMNTIQARVQERYQTDIQYQVSPKPLIEEDLQDYRKKTVIEEKSLSASETIAKYVWKQGSITCREAMDLLNFPRAKTVRLLHAKLSSGTLIATGTARARRYLLPPEASTPKEMLPPKPVLDTFWVTPGWLLAGNDFSTQLETVIEQIRFLTGKGITRILQILNNDFEDGANCIEAVQYTGASMKLQIIHLLARNQIQGVEEVLSAVDEALKQGEVVYISAPGIEQAAAIAACHLVQRGVTGPQALAQVTQLRQSGFKPWHTYPRTRLWRQFVLRWGRSHPRSSTYNPNLPTED